MPGLQLRKAGQMSHILVPDHPREETARLLGHARHCRQLATSVPEDQLVDQLMTLAKSYEAKAALLRANCDVSGQAAGYTSP
jgi:hypothetical protein